MAYVGRLIVAALFATAASCVVGGPVEVYLDGPEHCPHDRPAAAARITQAQAIARTAELLPEGYCGPTLFVTGCDFDAENEYDSWRIYVRQYQVRNGTRDHGGLLHTYLVLDAVGNCLAHIPGTLLGATH